MVFIRNHLTIHILKKRVYPPNNGWSIFMFEQEVSLTAALKQTQRLVEVAQARM